MTEQEQMEHSEQVFLNILKTNRIKYKTKKYYEYQYAFVNGAISVLGTIPPKWGVALMSSREIIEPYKL